MSERVSGSDVARLRRAGPGVYPLAALSDEHASWPRRLSPGRDANSSANNPFAHHLSPHPLGFVRQLTQKELAQFEKEIRLRPQQRIKRKGNKSEGLCKNCACARPTDNSAQALKILLLITRHLRKSGQTFFHLPPLFSTQKRRENFRKFLYPNHFSPNQKSPTPSPIYGENNFFSVRPKRRSLFEILVLKS